MTRLHGRDKPRNYKKIDMIGEGSKKGEMAQRTLAEQITAEAEIPVSSFVESAWRRYNDPKRRRDMFKVAKASALASIKPTP